jgi:hypothetical protein
MHVQGCILSVCGIKAISSKAGKVQEYRKEFDLDDLDRAAQSMAQSCRFLVRRTLICTTFVGSKCAANSCEL